MLINSCAPLFGGRVRAALSPHLIVMNIQMPGQNGFLIMLAAILGPARLHSKSGMRHDVRKKGMIHDEAGTGIHAARICIVKCLLRANQTQRLLVGFRLD